MSDGCTQAVLIRVQARSRPVTREWQSPWVGARQGVGHRPQSPLQMADGTPGTREYRLRVRELSGISTSPNRYVPFSADREAYGARKMWQLLNREGVPCRRHRVARLRRLAGIIALRRRCYVRTVQARQQAVGEIPNRLNQQFAVSAKNRVWAADYTFVHRLDTRPRKCLNFATPL